MRLWHRNQNLSVPWNKWKMMLSSDWSQDPPFSPLFIFCCIHVSLSSFNSNFFFLFLFERGKIHTLYLPCLALSLHKRPSGPIGSRCKCTRRSWAGGGQEEKRRNYSACRWVPFMCNENVVHETREMVRWPWFGRVKHDPQQRVKEKSGVRGFSRGAVIID